MPAGSPWAEGVTGRTEPAQDSLTLRAPLGQGTGGGSGSFWGAASDGNRWRVKPLNGPHGEMAPVNEFLVGRAGKMIVAPVCDVSLIVIPSDVAGWEFSPGLTLETGVASASREVAGCHEERVLSHRDEDDNKRRHVGVYALYDWCWGGDDQWLYETPADEAVHSHDHGLYFPGGPDWRAQDLSSLIGEPHQLGTPTTGLDAGTKEDFALRLDAVNQNALLPILRAVPTSWPVTDENLEALGEFLDLEGPRVSPSASVPYDRR